MTQTLIQLPEILNEEEYETYFNETSGSGQDILTEQHNEAVRTIALGHIIEKVHFYLIILFVTILILILR